MSATATATAADQETDQTDAPALAPVPPLSRRRNGPMTRRQNESKINREIANMMKSAHKLRADTRVEVGILEVRLEHGTGEVASSMWHATPLLTSMEDDMGISRTGLHTVSLATGQLRNQRIISGFSGAEYTELEAEDQISLLKWLFRLLIQDQRQHCPYNVSSIAQMQQKYPWYPAGVNWVAPKNLPAVDRILLFNACIAGLVALERVQHTINQFDKDLPLARLSGNVIGVNILRTAFNSGSQQIVNCQELSSPFVELQGTRRLGKYATSQQIVTLYNSGRSKQKKKLTARVMDVEIDLGKLYNTSQLIAPWSQVKDSVELMDTVLRNLGFQQPSRGLRVGVTRLWRKYIQPNYYEGGDSEIHNGAAGLPSSQAPCSQQSNLQSGPVGAAASLASQEEQLQVVEQSQVEDVDQIMQTTGQQTHTPHTQVEQGNHVQLAADQTGRQEPVPDAAVNIIHTVSMPTTHVALNSTIVPEDAPEPEDSATEQPCQRPRRGQLVNYAALHAGSSRRRLH